MRQNDRRVGGPESQFIRSYEVTDTAPRSAITLPQIVLRFQEKWMYCALALLRHGDALGTKTRWRGKRLRREGSSEARVTLGAGGLSLSALGEHASEGALHFVAILGGEIPVDGALQAFAEGDLRLPGQQALG
jgi:hypothetical protein